MVRNLPTIYIRAANIKGPGLGLKATHGVPGNLIQQGPTATNYPQSSKGWLADSVMGNLKWGVLGYI